MDPLQDLFAGLAAPFGADEVRIRPQGGRQLQYITARTVMNRLDDVLGPANWWDEYMPLENSVICRLTIRLPDGTTLTKSDAGGYAGMADHGDDDKSGFSDAFKRAAVKFGIGRYLYRDGVPRFVHERMRHPSLAADPAHSPQGKAAEPVAPPAQPASAPARQKEGAGVPQTGKSLFAWIKQQEEKHGAGLLKTISDWAQRQDFPTRMVQWNAQQVQAAFGEALAAIEATRQEPVAAGAGGQPADRPNGWNGSRNRARPGAATNEPAGARGGEAEAQESAPRPPRGSSPPRQSRGR